MGCGAAKELAASRVAQCADRWGQRLGTAIPTLFYSAGKGCVKGSGYERVDSLGPRRAVWR